MNKTNKSASWRQYHEAASVIADAFQSDPLFMKAFTNDRARYVATYAVAAAQIGSGSCSTDVLVDENTKVLQSACLWEETKHDYRLGVLELIVRNVIMAFSTYFYFVKGATYRIGYSEHIGGLLNAILVILYGVCTLWVIRFLLEFFRFGIVYAYIAAKGSRFISEYEKQHGKLGKHCKHLSMIGTLSAFRGQGIGSMLMKYTLQKVDSSNGSVVYDYQYLESSNPKNVPFYQRHGFVTVGEMGIMGGTVTYMIRKKEANRVPE